jgi:hypothetical protein
MSAKDVTETLTGYDQIFRRVMKKLQSGASPVSTLAILVNFDSGSVENSEALSNEITGRLSEIWNDISNDGQVKVHLIRRSYSSSVFPNLPFPWITPSDCDPSEISKL